MLQLQSGNCHPPLFFMFFNSTMPIGNKDNKDFSCPGPEMPPDTQPTCRDARSERHGSFIKKRQSNKP